MRVLDQTETQAALRTHGLDRPQGIGFVFLDPARQVFYDWHTHTYHQLIYATEDRTQIESDNGRHVLPQGYAAWIPAGVRHRTLITAANGASIFFSPETVPEAGSRVRILLAHSLMREMVLFATRWKLEAEYTSVLADSFMRALALLCVEWLECERPLFLPNSSHPSIRRAMDYAVIDPGHTTLKDALATAAMSERTFRRRFFEETGLGWQRWLTQARILTAMDSLTRGGRVTDVAAEVGYASLSAFAKAFAQLTGETPAAYRSRYRNKGGLAGLKDD